MSENKEIEFAFKDYLDQDYIDSSEVTDDWIWGYVKSSTVDLVVKDDITHKVIARHTVPILQVVDKGKYKELILNCKKYCEKDMYRDYTFNIDAVSNIKRPIITIRYTDYLLKTNRTFELFYIEYSDDEYEQGNLKYEIVRENDLSNTLEKLKTKDNIELLSLYDVNDNILPED